MKSKTKISKQIKRKLNPELVETINLCKKNNKWLEIASILSRPRKQRINLNLEAIENQSQEGDRIIIPGKVLAQGELSKKIKIIAFDFSDKAREKLLSSKCEVSSILNEIQLNKEMKGVKILK